MNKTLNVVAMLILCSVCSGAFGDSPKSPAVPKDETRFAEEFLTQLRKKNYPYVKSLLGEDLSREMSDDELDKIADYFRKGDLISTEFIGSKARTWKGVLHKGYSFEYRFTDGWNLASVVITKKGDEIQVSGMHVYQTPATRSEINSFSLSGKSARHYGILALAVGAPIFILITLVYCIKTPIKKGKWLWVIFILVGIGAIRINWTTGDCAFNLVNVQLLGAGIVTVGANAPWVLTASFPLGAVMFWCKRRKLIESAVADQPMPQTPDGAGDP